MKSGKLPMGIAHKILHEKDAIKINIKGISTTLSVVLLMFHVLCCRVFTLVRHTLDTRSSNKTLMYR